MTGWSIIVTVIAGAPSACFPKAPKPDPSMAESAHPRETTTPERAQQLMRWATYASVAVAAVLILLKTGAWLATESVAILSSLIDSLLDSVASLINLFAVRQALTPADREHRFGHGKAESLSGLGQSAFIAGSAIFLLFEAGSRLWSPRPVPHGDLGIAVMVISILLTFVLVRFQLRVVRLTGSTAIGADSLHYRADLLVNLAIILSLVLSSQFGLPLADPVLAIAVAGYILYSAWHIARDSLSSLMDKEMSDEDRQKILDIIAAHPEVKGVHDLRTRTAGTQPFIQFHLELDGAMTLHDTHIIADQVMLEVIQAFPGAEVIVHQDPAGIDEDHATIAD